MIESSGKGKGTSEKWGEGGREVYIGRGRGVGGIGAKMDTVSNII